MAKRKYTRKPKADTVGEPEIMDDPIEPDDIIDDVEPEPEPQPPEPEQLLCNIGGCGARVIDRGGGKMQCVGPRRHTYVK